MTKEKALLLIIILVILLPGCGSKAVPANTRTLSLSEEVDESMGVISDTIVDVFSQAHIQSIRISQALLNQRIKILDEKDIWVKVEIEDGSIGWVKSRFVERGVSKTAVGDYAYRVLVTSKAAAIYSQPSGGVTVKEVVMGSEFNALVKKEGSYEVMLPGGTTGWLSQSDTIQLSFGGPIPKTSAFDFVVTLEKFKGTSYLQGGISFRGIDYAGLTYICAMVNGVNLPRSAGEQLNSGSPVSRDELRPGDLVFFGTAEDAGEVDDITVYIGNGKYIHSNRTKGYVTVESFDEEYFAEKLLGIRRIFQ
mgnify:CR=1 FL=1